MSDPITGAGWIFAAAASVGVIYTLLAGFAVGWFFARAAPEAAECLPMTILKPLHGDEPGLAACLEGLCSQDYAAPVQIIFGVHEGFDPAADIVRQLIQRHPSLEIHLVINERVCGSNLKISNLMNMESLVRYPIVVVADSDISVESNYLGVIMAAMASPRIGYVTCAYVGVPTGSIWSRLSAMGMNYHFLPSVAFGLWSRLAKPCFGATIAFRKAVFDQAGGFSRFKDQLADDFEIGRAIRDLGYDFAAPPIAVGHICQERSGRSLAGHELRWARTLRLIAPLSYAGSAILHPLPFALMSVALLHGSLWSLVVLALVCGSRIFVMGQVDRLAHGERGTLWLWPVRDLFSAWIYLSAFLGKTATWRGRRFVIDKAGCLVPDLPAPCSRVAPSAFPVVRPARPASVNLAETRFS